MPELPELEFARRTLAPLLEGARVVAIHGSDARVSRPSPQAFEALVGARVTEVTRRGKWLRVLCTSAEGKPGDAGLRVFSHLGMTGRWVERDVSADAERFERFRLDVRHGRRLRSARYLDARRFGYLVVGRDDLPAWKALGPDALLDGVDPGSLFEALRVRRGPIKDVLLDQTLLAGLGNIQVTEALWRARIDPRSPSAALEPVNVRALARGIRASLEATLRAQEGEEIVYVSDRASPNPFRVYGRAGEPCPRCGAHFVKIVLAARGTTFCPGCQVRLGSPAAKSKKATASKTRR